MLWVLLPAAVWATDIWQAEMADGSLLFTDSPTVAGFRPVLLARKPMPARNRVSVGRFPRLDAYDSLIVRIAAEEGVSPALLKAVALADPAQLAARVAELGKPGDLVVCLGAGSITTWAHALPGELAALAQARAAAGSRGGPR